MNKQLRRPVQLEGTQIKAIGGSANIAYSSELVRTSAQALIPMGTHFRERDRTLVARILNLVDEEGVDVAVETWIRSPENSLPGIFWRDCLLHEWIRRDKDGVTRRYGIAKAAVVEGIETDLPKPGVLHREWDLILTGLYGGDLIALLDRLVRPAATLGGVGPIWIAEDPGSLATEVTRWHDAFASAAQELEAVTGLVRGGRLEWPSSGCVFAETVRGASAGATDCQKVTICLRGLLRKTARSCGLFEMARRWMH